MQHSQSFNLSISPQLGELLSQFAARQHKEIPAVAEALIREALELEEDMALSRLADSRLATAEEWVSHEDAWR